MPSLTIRLDASGVDGFDLKAEPRGLRVIVNCQTNFAHRNLSERSFQVTV